MEWNVSQALSRRLILLEVYSPVFQSKPCLETLKKNRKLAFCRILLLPANEKQSKHVSLFLKKTRIFPLMQFGLLGLVSFNFLSNIERNFQFSRNFKCPPGDYQQQSHNTHTKVSYLLHYYVFYVSNNFFFHGTDS